MGTVSSTPVSCAACKLGGDEHCTDVDSQHTLDAGTYALAAEDVSFAGDGSIRKKVLRACEVSKMLCEAASVRILIQVATAEASSAARSIPEEITSCAELEFTIGNGEVCDALECALPFMGVGERALISCTNLFYCTETPEAQQGPSKFSNAAISALRDFASSGRMIVEMIACDNGVYDRHKKAARTQLEFAFAREKVGVFLHRHQRYGIAWKRYAFILNFLPMCMRDFDTDDAQRAAALLNSTKVNQQACHAYWVQNNSRMIDAREQRPGTMQVGVCHGEACRRNGAEAVLAEIEELASMNDAGQACIAKSEECLGRCSLSPCVRAVQKASDGQYRETVFEEVNSVTRSEEVLEWLTGQKLCMQLTNPAAARRLSVDRALCVAGEAQISQRWNHALGILQGVEDVAAWGDGDRLPQLAFSQIGAFEGAGLYNPALERIDWLLGLQPEPDADLCLVRARLLMKLDRSSEAANELEALQRTSGVDFELQNEVNSLVAKLQLPLQQSAGESTVDGYAHWTLENVKIASKHTAIFRFAFSNGRRGTANPSWQLWHVTLLAAVGANKEGPLGFVERDYTPISDATAWEEGKCELLVKLYHDGVASKWLQTLTVGTKVLLSQPRTTLLLPQLVTPASLTGAFSPRSVLLLAGGTGLTPALGILDAFRLKVLPLCLVYSCRGDDILLLETLQNYVADRKFWTRIIVSISQFDESGQTPFPGAANVTADAKMFPQLEFAHGRISRQILQGALAEIIVQLQSLAPEETLMGEELKGLRVVTSGPQLMMDAMSSFLVMEGVPRQQITALKA